jgi:hypothetical protein
MAQHSITIINRNVGTSDKKTESKDKKTSAKNKSLNGGVSNRNKPMVKNNKNIKISKDFISGGLAVAAAVGIARTSINIYASVGDAATGNSIYYNNLRTKANAVLNPIGFVKEVTAQAILGNLRVQRENTALDYQRQLTGNLAFSRKTSSGTF